MFNQEVKLTTGSVVAFIRDHKGLKQEDICMQCQDVSRTMYSRIETGVVQATVERIDELAAVLGCSRNLLVLAQPQEGEESLAGLLHASGITPAEMFKAWENSGLCKHTGELLSFYRSTKKMSRKDFVKYLASAGVTVGLSEARLTAMENDLTPGEVSLCFKQLDLAMSDIFHQFLCCTYDLNLCPIAGPVGDLQVAADHGEASSNSLASTEGAAAVEVVDSTMERAIGLSIPRGATVLFSSPAGVTLSGRVVQVRVNGSDVPLIREIVDLGEEWSLLPWNERFGIKTVPKAECEIIGVATSYTVKL